METKAPPSPPGSKGVTQLYHCGTLTYTKFGLFAVFAWLLWGDLCFTLMESVVPSVLPIKLKALGASNTLLAAVTTIIPRILNMIVCPWVSFKSDRYRSRWGRRIPFILWTLPFLCISLVLMGFTDEITSFLHRHTAGLHGFSEATIAIGLIAVFIAMFSFFNMFVGSVFYYLFNDVVPPQFLGRFTGAFRVVGVVGGAGYNYFVFQFAESHMREIFIGAALLYFFGFGLMCLMVKEGEYPPVEGEDPQEKQGAIRTVMTFFKESFTHKIYWLLFLFYALAGANSSISQFMVFFWREMGLSLDQIGKLGAVGAVASVLAAYLAAVFIDRWHPLRVSVYLLVLGLAGTGTSWIWIFVTLPADYYFWLSLSTGVVTSFFGAFGIATAMPLFYKMFPQSRFGQFCSAQAMLASVIGLFAGVAAGIYIDIIKHFCGGSDFAYRFIFGWHTFFGVIIAGIMVAAYRLWYRLGGDSHFHPPATWSASGYEEMPVVTIIGPQTRWLKVALLLFNILVAASSLGILPLLYWMHQTQANTAFFWHAWVLFPLSLLAWGYWKWVEGGIRNDIARARAGETPRLGIPHHGMLLIVAAQFLLVGLGMWVIGVLVTLHLSMQTGAIVFTIGNVLTNFLLVGCAQILRWAERGYSTKVDCLLAEGKP